MPGVTHTACEDFTEDIDALAWSWRRCKNALSKQDGQVVSKELISDMCSGEHSLYKTTEM